MTFMLLMLFLAVAAVDGSRPMDQAAALGQFRLHKLHRGSPTGDYKFNSGGYLMSYPNESIEKKGDLLKDGLPGQPTPMAFKQFAGHINVDRSAGRALFYYFVESVNNSSTKPLILWLNGGPGCSSVGMGAFTEIGPFGVNRDGKTLYARQFAWNQVANILFLESPAGVGFSYSNTTSDYASTGDKRTSEDAYIFLINWFKRYPQYKSRDFYLIGESYAGHYIPELADIILTKNKDTESTQVINLQGIMIGNGLMNDVNDTRGLIDFAWSHALVSDETHKEFREQCPDSIHENDACAEAIESFIKSIGNINFLNIYSSPCSPGRTNAAATPNSIDPCDLLYVQNYLNLPHVQEALHANRTNLPYPWEPCSMDTLLQWTDSPSSMFPIYKRLMSYGLRILLYSGDADLCVPVTGSRLALTAMGLKVVEPWQWWTIYDSLEVAGYKVVYEGLTYATVRGAGHEVSRSHPDILFALLTNFLGLGT